MDVNTQSRAIAELEKYESELMHPFKVRRAMPPLDTTLLRIRMKSWDFLSGNFLSAAEEVAFGLFGIHLAEEDASLFRD
jgi:hypothetical protein